MAESEHRTDESPELQQIDITRLLAKAWKHFGKTWWLLLLLLALSVGLQLGYQHFFHVDEYEAYASFSVSVGSASSGMSRPSWARPSHLSSRAARSRP